MAAVRRMAQWGTPMAATECRCSRCCTGIAAQGPLARQCPAARAVSSLYHITGEVPVARTQMGRVLHDLARHCVK